MPMYDFECESCHALFEELALGAENPACPACGGPSRRCLSVPSMPHKNPFPFKIGPKRPTPSAPSGGCGMSCGSCQGGGQ